MAKTTIEDLDTDSLRFDHDNPRLAEYGITAKTPENEILQILWDAMDVRELVQSISASGYFRQHEPLIVAREGGKNVVIEGNRRLAAVKVLLKPELAKQTGWEIPKISSALRKDLETLPVIISTRKDSWRYLGFKHVNGPAKWSSYAKAKYIADVHRSAEFGKVSLVTIAEQIGDQHNTVQRLYRGLMVIEQAERLKVFDRNNRFNKRFAFSHLYTALDYEGGVVDFLKIAPETQETDNPVPKTHKKELGEVMLWMYGSKRDKRAPVVRTQNPDLKKLDDALKSKESVAALRDGADIDTAFDLGRPAEVVFEESLLRAKRELNKAQATMSEGYEGSEELLRVAGSVCKIADDIYNWMEEKNKPRKRARLTEEGS